MIQSATQDLTHSISRESSEMKDNMSCAVIPVSSGFSRPTPNNFRLLLAYAVYVLVHYLASGESLINDVVGPEVQILPRVYRGPATLCLIARD